MREDGYVEHPYVLEAEALGELMRRQSVEVEAATRATEQLSEALAAVAGLLDQGRARYRRRYAARSRSVRSRRRSR